MSDTFRDWSPDARTFADLLPPQHLEAEKGVLGSILIDNAVIPEVRAAIESCEDFFRDAHQILWRVFVDLVDAGKAVDPITVADALQRRGLLDDVGDVDYLNELCQGVPHAANAVYYAQIVRQKAVSRLLVENANAILADGYSENFTAEQLLDRARARVEAVEVAAPSWDAPDLEGLPTAPPFPLDVFPARMVAMVAAAAAALPAPADFLAIPCLAVASAAVGRSVALAVKSSWSESPGLYLAFCSAPGSIKSESLKIALRPLYELHSKELTAFLVEREIAAENKRLRELARKQSGSGGGEPPEPAPVLRRVLVGDTTTEKLAVVLSENPRGVLMATDELTSWMAGMDQYKSSGNDKQFYLSAWSGASISIDRKNQENGVPLYLAHPFLSVVGPLTPDCLKLFDAGVDDGFRDRILFSYPDPIPVRFSTAGIDDALLSDWSDAVSRLYARGMIPRDDGSSRPFVVGFTDAALAAFAAWFDAHCEESEASDFSRHLKGPWAKLRGYCARFALILSQLGQAYDPVDSDLPLPVGVKSVVDAVRLVNYFKAHARRVYHVMGGSEVDNDDARAILAWLAVRDKTRFTLRECRDNFRRRFAASPEGLGAALSWLSDRGAIRRIVVASRPNGGRPGTESYEVHSSICPGSARKTRKTPSDQ